jgi:hypothetical protein
MNLQNGYKVLYEKIADGERTFFADKMDGTEAAQIGEAIEIGKYKLIFEKDGKIYGSESGKTEDGVCLEAFNKVFIKASDEVVEEPVPANVEPDDNGNKPESTAVIEDEEELEANPEEEE